MNRICYSTVCACILALARHAHANILEISLDPGSHTPSDVDAQGIGETPGSVFGWLQGEILSYNNFGPGLQLPDPTDGETRLANLGGTPPSLQVEAGDYITIHYGAGANDTVDPTITDPARIGGLVAYYADSSQTFTPPANDQGSLFHGPILLVDVWDHTGTSAPDGGATALLLAGGLAGIGSFARFRKAGHS